MNMYGQRQRRYQSKSKGGRHVDELELLCFLLLFLIVGAETEPARTGV